MSDRQRRRRIERRRFAKAPPPAALRRVPAAPPPAAAALAAYQAMTTDEILRGVESSLMRIAEMQAAGLGTRAGGADRIQKAPKSFVGGPVQPAPARAVATAKGRGARTLRAGSRSCP